MKKFVIVFLIACTFILLSCSHPTASIGLNSGQYTAGKDFPARTYDIYAVSGKGTVSSTNMNSGGINAVMGADKDQSGDVQQICRNIKLPDGVTLTVDQVTIQLIEK